MTGVELIALAASLAKLAQKVITENREATEAEVDQSFADVEVARNEALEALARARAREAGDD